MTVSSDPLTVHLVSSSGELYALNYSDHSKKNLLSYEVVEDAPLFRVHRQSVTFCESNRLLITLDGEVYNIDTREIVNYGNRTYSMIIRLHGLTLLLSEENELFQLIHGSPDEFKEKPIVNNVSYIAVINHDIVMCIDGEWKRYHSNKPYTTIDGDLPVGEVLSHNDNVIRTTEGFWRFRINRELARSIRINAPDDTVAVESYQRGYNRCLAALTSDGRIFITDISDDNVGEFVELTSRVIARMNKDDQWMNLYSFWMSGNDSGIGRKLHLCNSNGELFKWEDGLNDCNTYPTEPFMPMIKRIGAAYD